MGKFLSTASWWLKPSLAVRLSTGRAKLVRNPQPPQWNPQNKQSMFHPTAIIDPGAKVPASCAVGPYCVIGPEVDLGEQCELISHVTIHGPSQIGSHNRFFPSCAVGIEPQDISFRGEKT